MSENPNQNPNQKPPTKEELENFMRLGTRCANKAVLNALKEVIIEGPSKGRSANEAKTIANLIDNKIIEGGSYPLTIDITEINYKLNLSLVGNAPRDYQISIDLSQKYANEFWQTLAFLMHVAAAYWEQWKIENPELFTRICKYRPDVDFETLKIDDKVKFTLYFDPECPRRVGIMPYYVDQNGQPLYKAANPRVYKEK